MSKLKSKITKKIQISQKQKYTNWDIIIIGDKYEPENELLTIINNYKQSDNKIIYINNKNVERDYIKNKINLWNCAGGTSMNLGLKYARENNYKYYCHLDDDDYWTEDHLLLISQNYTKYENCIFINTKSTFKNSYLPFEDIDIFENNRLPISNETIHSSFSFRLDILPFYYDTSLTENGINNPSDSLMLLKIYNYIINNPQYCSIYIPILTCFHDIEGYIKNT